MISYAVFVDAVCTFCVADTDATRPNYAGFCLSAGNLNLKPCTSMPSGSSSYVGAQKHVPSTANPKSVFESEAPPSLTHETP